MKKYIQVACLSFKMQIVWRFDVIMTMVSTIARILAAWILWSAAFDGKELIGGFTFSAMLSYYIIGSFIASLDMSSQISSEVSNLIRAGRFSGHMVTPMNPFGFFGSMIAGESAFHLGFSLLSIIICTFIFNIKVTVIANTAQMLLAIIMILLGLIFMACYQYFIGVLAFKFLDIGFFLHIQQAIISFAVGTMIPISLLPEKVLFVLRFFPFIYVVFTPTMLLTGQMSFSEGLFGFCIISVWTVIMFLMAQKTYNRLRVKFDGVGI